MELKNKSNLIRTLLLLKTASEIKKFILLPTKINSISPKNLYKLYNNIEISIEKRIFSTTERKNSQICNEKKSPIINTINEYSPINEPFYKLNKLLISFKKNKNFYETNDFYDNKYNNIISQESTDTSNSLNDKKKNLNYENDEIKNDHDSIKYLRKMAKSFIQKKKIKRKKRIHLKSFYENDIFRSEYNLNNLERKLKNSFTVNYSQNNDNIIIKNCFTHINMNTNLNINNFTNNQEPKKNNSLQKMNHSILNKENTNFNQCLFCPSPCEHKGISFYKNNNYSSSCNLNCKNHISKIKNENSNLRKSAFMCIPYKDIIRPNIFTGNNHYDNNGNIIIVNEK